MNFSIEKSIDKVPDDWDSLDEDIFLSTKYLKSKEASLPENYTLYYISIYVDNQLVAKSVCQVIEVSLDNVSKKTFLPKWILNRLKFNVFCFGNMFLTGNHIFSFTKDGEDFFLNNIELFVKEIEKLADKKSHLTLLKDMKSDRLKEVKAKLKDYTTLKVQPNMVLEIKEDWQTFEDYLLAMRTKYRTRAKRAFKKSKEINFIEFKAEEIKENETKIYQLFKNVANNAEVSAYVLPSNYFYELKDKLKDDFKLVVGKLNDEIVCFYTLILNKNESETGFLGYDTEQLYRHELYLRMLYEMINKSIELKKKEVFFSRTALEIKSSVGAEPIEIYGLAKAKNRVLNKFLPKIIDLFYKGKEWEKRNVFKD
ncbi:N-acetyltransferase [Weeksellaceae bacterium TAE3-ERU29]|nr:N-acetyltransferase [Weeksellaceae bacterium TAE3-ERU29]